jgi:hypothetical protein
MKTRIFAVIVMSVFAFSNEAQSAMTQTLGAARTYNTDPNTDNGVNIYPLVVTSVLNIEIDDRLAGGSITVSVFNSMGEIVLENVLGLGLNKIDASVLPKGNYVAVIRQNDTFQTKSNFEVK